MADYGPYSAVAWNNLYRNGDIPRHALVAIDPVDFDADLDGPALMQPEAAYNYQRMRDAAARQNITLAISYSYRTFAKQVEKFANQPPIAARPGTSNHGRAVALDLNIGRRSDTDHRPLPGDSTTRFNWLKRHAGRFGFDNLDAPSEPWHWTYRGGRPIPEEDKPMTPDEKAEFKELKRTVAKQGVTIASHEKTIAALRTGLNPEEKPASATAAGKRTAKVVVAVEEGG